MTDNCNFAKVHRQIAYLDRYIDLMHRVYTGIYPSNYKDVFNVWIVILRSSLELFRNRFFWLLIRENRLRLGEIDDESLFI